MYMCTTVLPSKFNRYFQFEPFQRWHIAQEEIQADFDSVLNGYSLRQVTSNIEWIHSDLSRFMSVNLFTVIFALYHPKLNTACVHFIKHIQIEYMNLIWIASSKSVAALKIKTRNGVTYFYIFILIIFAPFVHCVWNLDRLSNKWSFVKRQSQKKTNNRNLK